jgi:hypothetical protein
MGGIRKHGGHLHQFSIGALAAGASNDSGEGFAYHAYPSGSVAAGGDALARLDRAVYQLQELAVVPFAAHTGQATNFSDIQLTQYDSAANVKNQIKVRFDAAGKTMTAKLPMNLALAAGATVPNAGTAVIAVITGTALPWNLSFGDIIELARISEGTGNASPPLAASAFIGEVGA